MQIDDTYLCVCSHFHVINYVLQLNCTLIIHRLPNLDKTRTPQIQFWYLITIKLLTYKLICCKSQQFLCHFFILLYTSLNHSWKHLIICLHWIIHCFTHNGFIQGNVLCKPYWVHNCCQKGCQITLSYENSMYHVDVLVGEICCPNHEYACTTYTFRNCEYLYFCRWEWEPIQDIVLKLLHKPWAEFWTHLILDITLVITSAHTVGVFSCGRQNPQGWVNPDSSASMAPSLPMMQGKKVIPSTEPLETQSQFNDSSIQPTAHCLLNIAPITFPQYMPWQLSIPR